MLLFCYWQISRFITWLQEAEEESDDDDDDEEEWISLKKNESVLSILF